MVAGETSGDMLAAQLLTGLKARWPDLEASGIGGSEMIRSGFQALWSSDQLAVRGYVEVLRQYREIVGIRKKLKSQLLDSRPDFFVGIDAPDFNLDLEFDLKHSGIKTIHFVCPSIWAWRAKRIEQLRSSVDHVLCIFPFEVDLLDKQGVPATYVGHPLASLIPLVPDRLNARKALGLESADKVLAILPGSRLSEIKYLAKRFCQTAYLLHQIDPTMKFILPALPSVRDKILSAVSDAGMTDCIQVVSGQSHLVLAACDVALVASGTATLEAALYKRPMVVAYNMNWLTWQIMRRQKLQPWVALPNILCQDFVVPELLQDEATPQGLFKAVMHWFEHPKQISTVETKFTSLHSLLLRDTAKLATDAIEKVLES
jgi:lipid-A-disaccharide synthase